MLGRHSVRFSPEVGKTLRGPLSYSLSHRDVCMITPTGSEPFTAPGQVDSLSWDFVFLAGDPMAGPNQSDIHEAVRTQITQRFSYGEDWSALFDQDNIPKGDWNGRLLNWINFKLGTSIPDYPGALQAFAESQGFNNWASMNTIVFE